MLSYIRVPPKVLLYVFLCVCWGGGATVWMNPPYFILREVPSSISLVSRRVFGRSLNGQPFANSRLLVYYYCDLHGRHQNPNDTTPVLVREINVNDTPTNNAQNTPKSRQVSVKINAQGTPRSTSVSHTAKSINVNDTLKDTAKSQLTISQTQFQWCHYTKSTPTITPKPTANMCQDQPQRTSIDDKPTPNKPQWYGT